MKSKKSTTIFRSIAALLTLFIIGGWFSQPVAAQTPIRIGCDTGLLIDAINIANDRVGLDVIELAPNCTYLMDNFNDTPNALPVIIEPLRIEGKGARLLGPESARPRHFHAKAPLTLVDMILANGASATGGGAIFAEANLILIEVIFDNNFAINGGAVYAEGPLTITGGRMTKNQATIFGGAIYADGPSLSISNTNLDLNKAGNGGGAIFTTAPTTIINSRIRNSKANIASTDELVGCGGGIQSLGSLTLNQSQVNANEASRGGGVCALSTITASGTIFKSNTATLQGGALFSQNATTLLHNTFLRNKADVSGSALDLAQRGLGRSELINNVWLEQQGPAEVMCLFCVSQNLGQQVTVAHNTIANAESRSIDAIVVEAGQVNLVNSIIVNHKVGVQQQGGQVQTSRNLYFDNGQDELGNISSSNNHLTADPRFVDAANGNYRLQADSPAVGQAFADFSPTVDRRGVHRPQGNGPDIGAYEFDEGVVPASHVLTLTRCDVGELVAAIEQANAVIGAHRIELGTNCTYTLTTAAGRDRHGDPTGLPPVTEYLIIAGNGATVQRSDSAGDFRLMAIDQATLVMRDVTLQNGRGINEGGGMYVDSDENLGEELALTNVTLRDNTSSNNYGGGFYVDGNRTTISRSLFENNQADSGGGIYSDEDLRLIETTFRNNTAENDGGAINAGNLLEVEAGRFENNRALEGEGGGISVSGPLNIVGSTFDRNSALLGGGIYARSIVTLEGNSFVSNEASTGVGLLLEGRTAGNRISNNLWAEHSTTNAEASAVITVLPPSGNTQSDIVLSHNTIANATITEGSGVYVGGVSATLRNNIISNYQAALTIVAANDIAVIAEHNLTFTEGTSGTGVIDEQNNRSGDPRFVDPASGNYRLQIGSPAIDTGINAGLTVDLDGAARPFGPGFDIGAYEFGALSGGDFSVFLPLVVK